jgi:hypothetical protein
MGSYFWRHWMQRILKQSSDNDPFPGLSVPIPLPTLLCLHSTAWRSSAESQMSCRICRTSTSTSNAAPIQSPLGIVGPSFLNRLAASRRFYHAGKSRPRERFHRAKELIIMSRHDGHNTRESPIWSKDSIASCSNSITIQSPSGSRLFVSKQTGS